MLKCIFLEMLLIYFIAECYICTKLTAIVDLHLFSDLPCKVCFKTFNYLLDGKKKRFKSVIFILEKHLTSLFLIYFD